MERSTARLGTPVGFLVFGAGAAMTLVPLPAAAQDSAYGSRPFYAEETAMCYTEENEEVGVLSYNSAYWDDIYVPCFAFMDYCKNSWVLNVGDVRVGKIGSSYYSTPDAYFETGECGWATAIGPATGSPYSLYIYVDNVLAVNFNCSSGLMAGVRLVVEEHATSDCSGYAVRTWDDNQHCLAICVTTTGGYAQMAANGIGRCTPYDESTEPPFDESCRMPDLVIPDVRPGYTYLTRVQSAIYLGGSWQYWTEQTGCFRG